MAKTNWEQMEKTVISYRKKMEGYLDQILSILKERKLSPEQIKQWKLDDDYNFNSKKANSFFLNECLLLITKAFLHLKAVKHTNQTNNLHSLAVHARVVLECAGQIVNIAKILSSKKNKKNLGKELSKRLSDFKSVYFRSTVIKNISNSPEKLQQRMKKLVDEQYKKMEIDMNVEVKKTTWKCSETVNNLEHGKNWYNHISQRFFHSDIDSLKSNFPFNGGVLSVNQPMDIYSFAIFLDYLVHQSIVMILSISFFDSSKDAFYKYIQLIEEKKKASNYYKKELDKCIKK